MNLKANLIVAGVLLVAILGVAIAFTASNAAHRKEVTALQNEIAKRDQTIETQKGVYDRLAIQSKDLRTLLDQKDVQLKALQQQLKEQGATLLTATSLIVQLRKQLNSTTTVVVEPSDPRYPDIVRAAIDSKDDFSPFKVTGELVADCSMEPTLPTVQLHLSQMRPLKLNVVVSQDKTGTWRTSTTSSEDNFQIDIGLSAVNPYMLEAKWYEKIGFHADVGIGSGVLVGLGASYKIGKFTVGPTVWGSMGLDLQPKGFVGATMGWNPFQRN